jgi:hypothetical protein
MPYCPISRHLNSQARVARTSRSSPTIQFLFPKQKGGEDEAGEITSINGDVPQIIVQVPEDVEIRDKLG